MFTCGPAFLTSSNNTDPYWANVVSLLHFDGANGSTIFTDQISSNIWTPNAGCSISTASYKYGGSSGNFPLSTICPIHTPDNSSFQLGTGDFTIEGWFNPSAPSLGYGFWYCKGLNTVGGMLLGVTPTAVFIRVAGTTDSTFTVSISIWTHVAWVRKSGITTIYVGGLSVGSTSTVFNNNDTGIFYLGSGPVGLASSGYCYGNYLDEVRITKGVARYTANFTPPTTPFPNG